MSADLPQTDYERGYLAGFRASGEGHNGEYPYEGDSDVAVWSVIREGATTSGDAPNPWDAARPGDARPPNEHRRGESQCWAPVGDYVCCRVNHHRGQHVASGLHEVFAVLPS